MTDNNNKPTRKASSKNGKTSHKRRKNNAPALVEKFVIRLPSGFRKRIKQLSAQNKRSMNAEILMVLEKHMRQCNMFDGLEGLRELENESGEVELTEKQLNDILDSLPPEKKEALLELLG